MTNLSGPEHRTIEIAEQVYELLTRLGIDAAVIGAMALAVHRYIRFTRDFDFATYTDPFLKLPGLQQAIQKAGLQVELRKPDADDPLGGVLEITGKGFKPIQIVNLLNPLASRIMTLGKEAIDEAKSGLIEHSPMRVVTLPYLIALKLYGGGPKNKNDVIELLERNRPVDLGPVRDVCRRHALDRELESILQELGL